MRATLLALASVILRTKLVCALNDWSVPCTSGACSYGNVSKTYFNYIIEMFMDMYADLPNTEGGYSGTLEIVRMPFLYPQLTVIDWLQRGSPISDITNAAGWEILDCDQNAVEQDIRLVCSSSTAACDHLYSSGGAEGKIVRLPESVSVSPRFLAAGID